MEPWKLPQLRPSARTVDLRAPDFKTGDIRTQNRTNVGLRSVANPRRRFYAAPVTQC
jgi:hypothetical protein